MPVTHRGRHRQAEVVAGVVAERLSAEDARAALRELEGRGFSVITVPMDALAAASRAIEGIAETGPVRHPAAESATGLRGPELAGVTAAAAAALQPRLESQLQELSAFAAVVDAVTRPSVPPPGWFAQARRNAEARQELLDEFGALTSQDIATLAGSKAANRRATALRWQAEHKIFSVVHHGRTLYPGFQFDPELGRPKQAVADILASLPREMKGWALALWWTTPIDLLGWSRPVDLLDTEPDRVAEAARKEAEEWAVANPD